MATVFLLWPGPSGDGAGGNRRRDHRAGGRITGRPARTFRQWATDHAADFR